MTTSEQIDLLAAACAKAQADLRPAIKEAVNPAFRSKYADHHAIVEAAKVYSTYGVAVFQDVTLTELGSAVVTRLAHSSGQWIEFGPLTVPLSKRDAHGVGSATTYAKRYALSAALGIAADEDDDGNAAAALTKGQKPAPPQSADIPLPDDQHVYIRRLDKKGRGDKQWADATLSTGEVPIVRDTTLIPVLQQARADRTPVKVRLGKTEKGYDEILEVLVWTPPEPVL